MARDHNDVLREEGPDAIRAMFDEAFARQRHKANGSARNEEDDQPSPKADEQKRDDKKPKPRFASFSIDDIEEPSLDASFFIYGLVPRYGVHVYYGPSSVGKTFGVIHQTLHVATGKRYAGRHTERALVIYVTGEGKQAFRNRIWLARQKLGIKKGEAAFRGITDMPNMGKGDKETRELLERIKQVAGEPQYAGLPVVTVIDTASTALKGAKEDEVGLGALISNCRLIAEAMGGLTIVIHHTGKNTSRGSRGSYITDCNSDAVTCFEENEAGTGGSMTIEKMREGTKNISLTFERRVETLGKDKHGNDVTTCHIELTSEPKPINRQAGGKRGAGDIAFDEAVEATLHAHGFEYKVDGDTRVKVRAVAIAHIKEEFKRRYAIGKDGAPRGRTAVANAFTRALEISIKRRYRTRTVTIESDADVTRYGLAKNQVPEPNEGGICEVEIIWNFKHEPKPLVTGFSGGDEE